MSNSTDESLELTKTSTESQIEVKLDADETQEKSKVIIPEREAPKEEINQTIYGNDYSQKSPRKMGNTYTCLYYKEQPLIVVGPDFLFYVGLSSIVILIYTLLFLFGFKNNFVAVKVLETLNFLTLIISYSLTALMNPGIPSKYYYFNSMEKIIDRSLLNKDMNPYRRCRKCNILILKNMGVCHCVTCNVCVMNHDHHCPWTGKCIGKYNRYPFYIFVGSGFSFFTMSFVTFICHLATMISQ